jgi:hypothetical protein
MCHRVSAATAWRCACGYEFGQSLERVRELLRDQQTSLRIALAFLLVLDVAAVAGAVYAAMHGFIVFSALGFTTLILATARAAQKLWITRASLRQLASRDTLPRAVVHRR